MTWNTNANVDPKLQDWGEAYKDMCELLKAKVPEIKHMDLYYGQDQVIDSEGNWIPFRAPAVFLEFQAPQVNDLGDLVQQMDMDITVWLATETVQDTNHGSAGQRRAMEFVELMRKIHLALHNASGDHFSPLSRVAMSRKADAPPYMYMYGQTYRCVMLDNSTSPQLAYLDPPIALEIDPVTGEPATPPDPTLVVVRNSDGTYSINVQAGTIHNLPNVTHTDSNGDLVTLPGMTAFVATQCEAQPAVLVTNSDASYSNVASPPGPLVLQDVTHTNALGQEVTLPGMQPFVAVAIPPSILRQYTASATWSKPASPYFKGVWVFTAGAGGGAGSGRSAGTGSFGYGGESGGGGAYVRRWISAADLAATESVVIGTGGVGGPLSAWLGGAGQNGQPGAVGGDSMFGSLVRAKGGSGGGGGTSSTTVTGATSGGAAASCIPARGPSALSGSTAVRPSRGAAPGEHGMDGRSACPSGGGGCGINSAGTAEPQNNAGGGVYVGGVLVPGGAGSDTLGANGSNGTNDVLTDLLMGLATPTIGVGTAGGAGVTNVSGSNGGDGGNGGRGAGGGAGAGCRAAASGKGGNGGDGFVLVYEQY